MEEVRQCWTTKAGGEKLSVGAVGGHRAQVVVAADDGDGSGDEARFGEGYGEADTPGVH